MSSLDRGPRQLAEAVLRALSLAVVDVPIPAALALFFDVVYEVSFRLEREPPAGCSLLWQEPAPCRYFSSAFEPPQNAEWEKPGQNYVPFVSPIPFSVSSVLNLAKALEPAACALAVHGTESQPPMIHGLVHYGAASSQLSPALWETQAGVCGSFRATIVGPAHISVDAGLDYPIELKRNSLRAHAHSVLRRGPVRDRVSTHLSGLYSEIQSLLSPDVAASPFLEAKATPLKNGNVLLHEFDWSERLEKLWLNTLTRVLLKIRENNGGGMVLVTPKAAASPERDNRIHIPYALAYSSLRLLLQQRGAYWMTQFVLSAQALSEQPLSVQEMRPADLALPEPDSRAGPPGNDSEINQAIAFAASLARMEGMLILNPQLEIMGFGGQGQDETGKEVGGEVYLAANEMASEESLSAVPAQAFGPRCQALIQQCRLDPDAVGFFLTQDGDFRAVMQHKEKNIVWDPVRLPQH